LAGQLRKAIEARAARVSTACRSLSSSKQAMQIVMRR
jgi:hypothetical protein